MPGVYRDENGTYTYQTNNDYEDRRRRDLDDAYAGRPPFGPQPPDPRPRITWNPPPAPAPSPPIANQIPSVVPPPANDGSLEILTAAEAIERAKQDAWFDRLVGALPNQVGESPTFDNVFEDPNTPTITMQELLAQLNA